MNEIYLSDKNVANQTKKLIAYLNLDTDQINKNTVLKCKQIIVNSMNTTFDKYGRRRPPEISVVEYIDKMNKKSLSDCIKIFEEKKELNMQNKKHQNSQFKVSTPKTNPQSNNKFGLTPKNNQYMRPDEIMNKMKNPIQHPEQINTPSKEYQSYSDAGGYASFSSVDTASGPFITATGEYGLPIEMQNPNNSQYPQTSTDGKKNYADDLQRKMDSLRYEGGYGGASNMGQNMGQNMQMDLIQKLLPGVDMSGAMGQRQGQGQGQAQNQFSQGQAQNQFSQGQGQNQFSQGQNNLSSQFAYLNQMMQQMQQSGQNNPQMMQQIMGQMQQLMIQMNNQGGQQQGQQQGQQGQQQGQQGQQQGGQQQVGQQANTEFDYSFNSVGDDLGNDLNAAFGGNSNYNGTNSLDGVFQHNSITSPVKNLTNQDGDINSSLEKMKAEREQINKNLENIPKSNSFDPMQSPNQMNGNSNQYNPNNGFFF